MQASNWLLKQYPDEVERKAVQDAYATLARTEDGARVLEDLRRFCFVYGTTIVTVPTPAQTTESNEGRRQVYQHVVAVIETPSTTNQQQRTETDGRDTPRRPEQ